MNKASNDQSVFYEPSRRVTQSRLDELVDGHFVRLNLHQFEPLMGQLDAAKNWLMDNRDKVDTSRFDPTLDREIIADRISTHTLRALQSDKPDKFTAQADQNQIKANMISFRALTTTMAKTLEQYLQPRARMRLFQSGRNWYPPGGYMGWHTNSDVQGFRLYCSHAAEAEASFFRFEDPGTKEIVTSWDKAGWNFRCFRTDLEPLWHCVYSETERISIGYGLKFPEED